ncbi:MAG: hypothetical protein SGJ21_11290 [Alphaproteobacteria bacterium]|nr:hypothetical protein [Alphaproteobacteria bacterium]
MRGLLIHWDEALDGAFRRRFEAALADLRIDHADALVDQDAEASPRARLIVAGAGSKPSPGLTRDATIILAGPGLFASGVAGLRLEAADIDARTRRWTAVAEKLGAQTGRPGLAALVEAGDDPDTLRARLDVALRDASAAESERARLERERDEAMRARKHVETALAAERAEALAMRREIARLEDLATSSVFALSFVPDDHRRIVERAREQAALARLASTRAAAAAATHPDALVWPKAHAMYSGETRNGLPHGEGVLVFHASDRSSARYAGEFRDGVRAGHGVGLSEEGHVWTGAWRDNEAHGCGLLETPDGRRFEGEVAPDETRAPRRLAGWSWEAAAAPGVATVHTKAVPRLAAPSAGA